MLEQLSAYLDGDLPAVECETIERHARRCTRCTAVIADLRKVGGLCRRAASTPLPPAVRRRAQEHIRRLMDDRTRTSRHRGE
jgi:anti-sigma factor RsiW